MQSVERPHPADQRVQQGRCRLEPAILRGERDALRNCDASLLQYG
jgi:hypothetical protein